MSTSTTQSMLPPFLRIPPEIRLMIYHLLLVEKDPLFLGPCWWEDRTATNLLGMCTLINAEAAPIYYGKNSFEVNHQDTRVLHALVKIGGRNFDVIRKGRGLTLYFHYFEPMDASDLVSWEPRDHSLASSHRKLLLALFTQDIPLEAVVTTDRLQEELVAWKDWQDFVERQVPPYYLSPDMITWPDEQFVGKMTREIKRREALFEQDKKGKEGSGPTIES
ncbi:MAG: hypothetical protein M1816_003875 [Peltula sp. TS41687]|nr:MAG: hypothetical protein M1816_003875 [Peltula sp. TS41687]